MQDQKDEITFVDVDSGEVRNLVYVGEDDLGPPRTYKYCIDGDYSKFPLTLVMN